MRGIGDVRYDGHNTEHKPAHQYHDGALIELDAETWIVLAAQPKVAKQTVVHTGHAANVGATDDILAQIAEDGRHYNER